jgi:hypothetical protein
VERLGGGGIANSAGVAAVLQDVCTILMTLFTGIVAVGVFGTAR